MANNNNVYGNTNGQQPSLACLQAYAAAQKAYVQQQQQQQQAAALMAQIAAVASGAAPATAAIKPPRSATSLTGQVWAAAQAWHSKHGTWPNAAQLLAGPLAGHNSNTVATQLSRCANYYA